MESGVDGQERARRGVGWERPNERRNRHGTAAPRRRWPRTLNGVTRRRAKPSATSRPPSLPAPVGRGGKGGEVGEGTPREPQRRPGPPNNKCARRNARPGSRHAPAERAADGVVRGRSATRERRVIAVARQRAREPGRGAAWPPTVARRGGSDATTSDGSERLLTLALAGGARVSEPATSPRRLRARSASRGSLSPRAPAARGRQRRRWSPPTVALAYDHARPRRPVYSRTVHYPASFGMRV